MNVLLFISVIPSIILGKYIYDHDTQEKEPKKLLKKLFIGGILGMILAGLIESGITDFLAIDEDNLNIEEIFLFYFLVVGLVEEFCKWIFLYKYTWNNKEFNYLYDGLVYAAFSTLGFATIENILYVFSYGLSTGLMRAVVSVPGHFFFGITMGYFYAKAKEAQIKNNQSDKSKYLLLSILVPTLLHGLCDSLLSIDGYEPLIIYFIYIIILYIVSFKLIKKMSLISSDITGRRKLIHYCPNCGRRLSIELYCPDCGQKVNKN